MRTHGKYATYVSGGCRCAECCAAHTEKQRAYRAHRLGTEPPIHGVSAYENWGCRCEVCRAAKSVRNRREREARKAATS